MKIKKSKGLALYNCRIYSENEVTYVERRYKEHRIQFDNVRYFNWCEGWFIYKNLELNLDSLPAVYLYAI